MLIAIIAVSLVTFLVYYNVFKDRSLWRKIALFRGKPTLPIIGNLHQFRTDPHGILVDMLNTWREMDHQTFKLKLGLDVGIIISSPECAEVLVKHSTQIEKTKSYNYLLPWIGDGLLLSSGDKWRRQRKIITPTFHFKILEQFVSVFNCHAETLVEILEDRQGEILDISSFVSNCALDNICETAMGVKVNAQEDTESDYVMAVREMCNLYMRRAFTAYKRINFIYKLTADYKLQKRYLDSFHGLSERVIKNRKEEMRNEIKVAFSSNETDLLAYVDSSKKKYRPFLDLLLLSKLPDGKPLDDKTIRDEVDTFIFEGFDTTTSALMFCLYELSKHPEIQNKAFEEQLTIFGSDIQRDPLHSDLLEMSYLERVIKETLRLYPSVPLYSRNLTEDVKLPDGKIAPAKASLALFVYAMHRNPNYYDNPEEFDPDRFLSNKIKDNPFLYLPFSAGPRNCIGQKFAMLEIKSIISKVLRRFALHEAGSKYDIELSLEITLKSRNGVHVKLEKRKY